MTPIINQVEALIGSMESSYHWEENPSEDQETPPRATHRGLWERGGREGEKGTRGICHADILLT